MRITVMMPVYNAARHLEEAVRSVLAQTHTDFELIIVNDGSQDESASILERLATEDSRITVLNQENQGIAASLNRALHAAKTDWVAVMHADDVMLPHRLAKQIEFIEKNPDVKVTSCKAQYVSAHGKRLGQTSSDLLTREQFHWHVQNQEAIGLLHPGVFFNKHCILAVGGYRQAFWPAEDIDLWNRVAETDCVLLVQDEVLMEYRIHTGSVSTSRFKATRLKYEWVRVCMRARRAGLAEPDWEHFQKQWNQGNIFTLLNRERKINAKALYHGAGHDCLNGHYMAGFLKLGLATLCQPAYVLPRLKDQVLR